MVDEWNGFADLLANLIEKYVNELDLDALSDPKKVKKLDNHVGFDHTSRKSDIENNLAA